MAGFGKRWAASLALGMALGGSAWGQIVFPPGSSIDLAGGSFTSFCVPVSMGGELALGTGTFDSGSLNFATGSTVTGTGGVLNVGGDLTSASALKLGTSSVVLSDTCAPGTTLTLSGNIVVKDLTLISTGTTPPTIVLPAGTNLTVLGTLTLGAPGKPVVLTSSGPGTAVVTLGPSATVSNPSGSAVPGNVQIGAPVVTSPASIPTLNAYGLMLMSLLLGGMALHRQRNSPRS
ncbi:IPTL-CTERM sorting domain-containing protein [Delftia acidovorans]|uniref:IPTL-CTERM sorting domain-containing protein n=1 Tax=Delftia acidovorans TaxID=80866 RepID=UPI00301ADF46